MSAELVQIDEFRCELAKRTDISEVRTLHNVAESVRRYGETEEIRKAGAIAKLWAAHRGGELLAELERNQGARTDRLPATAAGSSPYRSALNGSGLDERLAQRWQEFRRWLPPVELEHYIASDADSREVTLARALRLARDKKAAAEREAVPVRGKHKPDLRVGRFQDALADVQPHSIDAILTDPPYQREALNDLRDLAAMANGLLKPDGIMVVLYGQTWLPDAMRALSAGPPWRWCGCYQTPGTGYASQARRVQSTWKPLLVYGGGPRFGDVIRSTGDDKTRHGWGQNGDAWLAIVKRFVDPSLAEPVVCDPFLGAGTTGMAALAEGCRFIGCDIDPAHVDAARKRLDPDDTS